MYFGDTQNGQEAVWETEPYVESRNYPKRSIVKNYYEAPVFKPDPLYNYRPVEFDSIIQETEKAIRFVTKKNIACWVPKSLIKQLNTRINTMLIWRKFDNYGAFVNV